MRMAVGEGEKGGRALEALMTEELSSSRTYRLCQPNPYATTLEAKNYRHLNDVQNGKKVRGMRTQDS